MLFVNRCVNILFANNIISSQYSGFYLLSVVSLQWLQVLVTCSSKKNRMIKRTLRYCLLRWRIQSVVMIGFVIALVSTILLYGYIRKEFSYDRFHENSDRIVRLTKNTNRGSSSMIDARLSGHHAPLLKNRLAEVEDFVRISHMRKSVISFNNREAVYSDKIYAVDSTFLKIFDFPLLAGDRETIFTQPHQAVVTKSFANRYFGNVDVLGRKIKILKKRDNKKKEYTISAIIEDFPSNSHFKADVLTSIDFSRTNYRWTYTYLLLSRRVNVEALEVEVQKSWHTHFSENPPDDIVDLQLLTDIHFYSHKSREFEVNGNIRNILILIVGGLFVFIISLMNFSNINYVQSVAEGKSIMVKMTHGASKLRIVFESSFNNLFVMMLSSIISILLLYRSVFWFDIELFEVVGWFEYMIVFLLFVVIYFLFSLLPFIGRNNLLASQCVMKSKGRVFNSILVLQFSLSMVVIVSTLVFNKQMQYLNRLHPVSADSEVIVIPRNTRNVVDKYEIFRDRVRKLSSIIDVTAASEKPGSLVTDNFRFSLDGVELEDDKTLNVFSVDHSFFDFFNIKAFAGKADMGNGPSQRTEQQILRYNRLKNEDGYVKSNVPVIENDKYVLNRSALKHLGVKSAEDVLNKRFKIDFIWEGFYPEGEIVGVVDDFHYSNLYSKEKPMVMFIRKTFCMNFLIKIQKETLYSSIDKVKEIWQEMFPTIPFYYELIGDSYDMYYKKEYSQMRVMSIFALMSILLSALGMYVMTIFRIQKRTKEIGIRKVNGAKTSDILLFINREFIYLFLISCLISIPTSYWIMDRWLQNFAYRADFGYSVFVISVVLIFIVVFGTVSWQSWRAATKNPKDTLRYE